MGLKTAKAWAKRCERCMEEGLESHEVCEYYGEPNGCHSPIYGMHPIGACGNAPRLVKALLELRDAFDEWNHIPGFPYDKYCWAINLIDDALHPPCENESNTEQDKTETRKENEK